MLWEIKLSQGLVNVKGLLDQLKLKIKQINNIASTTKIRLDSEGHE